MADWISVEDRLPECALVRDIFKKPTGYYSDKVLVCVKSTECDGVRYFVGTDIMRGPTLEKLDWLMSCGYGGTAVYHQEITHWMPLPAAPGSDPVRLEWDESGPGWDCPVCGYSCDDPFYLDKFCPGCGTRLHRQGED